MKYPSPLLFVIAGTVACCLVGAFFGNPVLKADVSATARVNQSAETATIQAGYGGGSSDAAHIVFQSAGWTVDQGAVQSVTLQDNGELHIIRKWTSRVGSAYAIEGAKVRYDVRVWKDIYTSRDGKIVKARTIEGKYTPEETVTKPEVITWPE